MTFIDHESFCILIVDDVPKNIQVLGNILRQEGYTVSYATNGLKALSVIAEQHYDLILLDVMMPEMDGFEVCRRLKTNPSMEKTPIIFITALNDEENEIKGFKYGAVDYITKPFKPDVVKARVKNTLELHYAKMLLENQNVLLEHKVHERTKKLTEMTDELHRSRKEIIHRLVSAAEYKDPETGAHIKRMGNYSAFIARLYGLDEAECDTILLSSTMHDIGKIGIPDHILLKPGKLDKNEWIIMKSHTTIGEKLLSHSESHLLKAGQIIAISHHEKWDGSGYPYGLKGTDIPLYGRITAMADVFDALTSKRPYKDPWSTERAVEEINNSRGFHFEPKIVDLFVDNLDKILEIKKQFPD
ncbi:MAG: two-component system response regulator [Desulfobacterales bacterium]|nr:two-component system response regulator [Desulfobacterales bacterium]